MDEKDILELRSKYEFQDYLKKLQEIKEHCLILMAVRDTPGNKLSDEELTAFRNMGFQTFSNKLWVMHIGIMVKGVVIKDTSGVTPESNLEFESIINNLKVNLVSKAWKKGNDCCIKINDVDYSQKVRGINIVVYDFEKEEVVDSIGYDAHMENPRFIRNYIKFKKSLYRKGCMVKNILPADLNKLKIRILQIGDLYFWNVVNSLVMELFKEKDVDLKIILLPFTQRECPSAVSKWDLSYVYFNEYNIEMDKPDILIFTALNDLFPLQSKDLRLFREHSKMLIHIPLLLILNAYDSIDKYRRILINGLKKINIDYILLDKLMYNRCLKYGIDDDFLIEMGNPKFDAIYKKVNSVNENVKEWEKIRNRKTILWLLDHDWETGTNVSFDLYAKRMFDLMKENEELALVFRPHPHFLRDTKKLGLWSDNDEKELRRYINNSPNIIWDERPDYSLAYQCADYILSDVESGTIVSAMVTKKPICIMYRYDCIVRNNNPEVTDNFYSIRSLEDLDKIIEMIKAGEDPMYEQRCNAIHNFVSHFDGKNGERIKDFVLEKYYEKFGRDADDGE